MSLTRRNRIVLEDLASRVGLRQDAPELYARAVTWRDPQDADLRVVVKPCLTRSQITGLKLRAGPPMTAQQAMTSSAPILAPIGEVIPVAPPARTLSADHLYPAVASLVQHARVVLAKWKRETAEWAALQVAQNLALQQVRERGLTGFSVMPDQPHDPAIAFMANTPVVGRAAAHGDLVHLSLDNLSATDAAAILQAAAVILKVTDY